MSDDVLKELKISWNWLVRIRLLNQPNPQISGYYEGASKGFDYQLAKKKQRFDYKLAIRIK